MKGEFIMEQLSRATVASMKAKAHRLPERLPFECIALLLQGGGALGSYQAGVYAALAEADLLPDWVAGISIGAINGALIAGNVPERRIERLRDFWEQVTAPRIGSDALLSLLPHSSDTLRAWLNQANAVSA